MIEQPCERSAVAVAPQDVGNAVAIEIADRLYLPSEIDAGIAHGASQRRPVYEPKQHVSNIVSPQQVRILIPIEISHGDKLPVERCRAQLRRRNERAVSQVPHQHAAIQLVAPDDIELPIAVEIA